MLIAEPHADTRALYAECWRLDGWIITECEDGREAMAHALTSVPSLVVTELHVPGVDGFALCEILRRDSATASVPILVATAEGRALEIQRARNAGADAALVKPIRWESLRAEAERLISHAAVLRGRTESAIAKAISTIERTRSMIATSSAIASRVQERGVTVTPPTAPPELRCASCKTLLVYEYSYVGGVRSEPPDQWDYYRCPRCGPMEYRQRTRKLRRRLTDV